MTKIQKYVWVFLAITICQIVADENPIKTETTVTHTTAYKGLTELPHSTLQNPTPTNTSIDLSPSRQVKLESNRNENTTIAFKTENKTETEEKKTTLMKKVRTPKRRMGFSKETRRTRRPTRKSNTIGRNNTAKLRREKKQKSMKAKMTNSTTVSTAAPVTTTLEIKQAQTRNLSHYHRKGVFGRRDKNEKYTFSTTSSTIKNIEP